MDRLDDVYGYVMFIIWRDRSTSDYVPFLLLRLGTDAWPAMLLISQHVFRALNIRNNINSLCLNGFRAVNNSPLDVDCAFELKFLGASGLVMVIDENGLWLLCVGGLQVVDGDGCEQGSDCDGVDVLHVDILLY